MVPRETKEEEQMVPGVGNKTLTVGAGIFAVLLGGATPFFQVWGELSTLEKRVDKRYERLHHEDEYLLKRIETQQELINQLENDLIKLSVYKESQQ